jgi:hypothetical protein
LIPGSTDELVQRFLQIAEGGFKIANFGYVNQATLHVIFQDQPAYAIHRCPDRGNLYQHIRAVFIFLLDPLLAPVYIG